MCVCVSLCVSVCVSVCVCVLPCGSLLQECVAMFDSSAISWCGHLIRTLLALETSGHGS